jgi:hypothetical protein
MNVRLVLELGVGDTPTADGITYFIGQYGLASPDDSRTAGEWVEAVIIDCIEDLIAENNARTGSHWAIHTSTVSESP